MNNEPRHYTQRAQAKTFLNEVRKKDRTVDDYVRMLMANDPEMAVRLEETYEEYAAIFGKVKA